MLRRHSRRDRRLKTCHRHVFLTPRRRSPHTQQQDRGAIAPRPCPQYPLFSSSAAVLAVLGVLVVLGVLGILGVVLGAKASENLENAKANMAKAKEFREEMETASALCNGIRKRSAMFERFLLRLQTVFDPLVYRMSEIIAEKGADYRKFSEEEKQVVASAMSLAGAIKAILDTAILDKEGNLTEESGVIIGETKKKIETIIA